MLKQTYQVLQFKFKNKSIKDKDLEIHKRFKNYKVTKLFIFLTMRKLL